MRMRRRIIPLAVVAFALVLFTMQALIVYNPVTLKTEGSPESGADDGTRIVDVGNNQQIELGPGEELHRFVLTEQGWVEWTGTAAEMTGGEYGNRTDIFTNNVMTYHGDGSILNTSVNIPTGADWEAYYVEAQITDLTENRTWVQNPDFATAPSSSDWSTGTTNAGSYSTPVASYNATGDASGGGCIDVEINSNSGSAPYFYDAGDFAYAQQSMTIDRGSVVWAGIRLDYWADTRDDTHYGMTGSFAVYARVEGSMVWQLVFDDIAAEETWYDSGLVSIDPSIFSLTTVDLEVGLWSKQSVGYDPDLGPRAKFDNVELYVKTLATPSNVNMAMNGEAVTSDPGWGVGHIFQTPTSPWTTDPVQLNFTWYPTPVSPTPNRTILVEFDLTVNMFARHLGTKTVYDISPTAYGESFSVQNGTDALFSTWFYADIPDGYPNRYFFNLTTPSNRDVYSVAKPLDPATNLTTGWSGGAVGDGYLNVSAYKVATEAGRYGYWRILSSAPNMISNVEIWDPVASAWKISPSLRAGAVSQVRVYTGVQYTNSVVNITLFDPTGASWYTTTATVDGSGYATTSTFTLSGSTASAGSWMVQAFTEDSGTNTVIHNAGFFKRAFRVVHSSEMLITYPSDAVGTWTANVTYGDLVLVILKINDTDSNVLVPGGTLQYNWAGGSGTFDDSGNGEYTKVIDTKTLPGKGPFVMTLTWTHESYDTALESLLFNVHYDAVIESPQYPGISGALGKNQWFDVNYTNINGTGITGATITCNWTGSYSVAETGGGIYRVTLDVTGVPLGEYPVKIFADAPYVLQKSMILFVEVREIYNTISYTANQLSIPVGESASFTLTWTDTDSDVPISGSNSSIACNWTSFHSAGEKNYSVIETSPGVYEITIFTESDDPLTAPGQYYTINFTVTKFGYQNHTFTVQVEIRSHNTLFILDQPIEQTPYQNDIVILVEYRDTDLGIGIVNTSGYVCIEVTTPYITLSWTTAVSSLGDGHYNITLKADQWGTIGWKDLRITVRWTDPGTTKYKNGTIDTTVRILGTDTDLYLEQAPTATYYLENLTFTAVYWDAINSTRISNSTGYVHVLITALTAGHPVTQADFVITEDAGTPGTYSFTLNSSQFGLVGTFVFRIDFMWASGQPPLYENKTMDVTLVVLKRPTYIDYSPVLATPYGQIANFTFRYVDSLSTQNIPDSASLTINLTESSVDYTVTYDALNKMFTIAINTSSFGTTGTFSLHVNVYWSGLPYYSDVINYEFTLLVTLRNTQLSYLSVSSTQWGNNVTIEFIYTDLVSGSSAGMTGTLSVNSSLAGWYTVTSLGNGHYLFELNTSGFASDGIFTLNASIVYTGSYFEADAYTYVSIVVTKRVTLLGYSSPDPTPYAENVTIVVRYTDDSTGNPIEGASVTISCSNASGTFTYGVNYWVTYLGDGQYQILADSAVLGAIGSFPVSVSISRSGAPFYQPIDKTINSRVVQRVTQILITQTPGEVPFGENVTLKFKFSDFLTGDIISITKAHITLSHGPSSTVITSSEYALHFFGTYYEISFDSTILNPTALVSNEEIQLLIDRSSGAPFYAPRDTKTYASTVERPTQIYFPLVETTPYLDNISVVFQYIDYISDAGISGASTSISFLNGSVTYYLIDNGDGSYEMIIPTTQFSGAGSIYFNITLSKSGVPFYSSRTVTGIRAVIRVIQTNLVSEAPPPASLPIGELHIVNVTFVDADHDVSLSGATIVSDWYSLYGTNITITEIGNGKYQLTINTTGLLAQSYTFTVTASLTNYRTAEALVLIQPGALTVDIFPEYTTYYADWADIVPIRVVVIEPYHNSTVPGMTVELLWNVTLYNFTDLGNGTYVLFLDTSTQNYGTYDLTIRVSREFYQTRSKTVSLILSKVSGIILPQSNSIEVIPSTQALFWVYLESIKYGAPVYNATVTVLWNDTEYLLTYNGTPGYYEGYIDVTGFAVGQYTATLHAAATNFDFIDITIDVAVVPVYTSIGLAGDVISVSTYYGDTVILFVEYNDTLVGERITAASVSYRIGGLSGFFEEQPDHTYRAEINTSLLNVQSYQMVIVGARSGYATAQRTIVFNVLEIPTDIIPDAATKTGYHGDSVTFSFYFNNTHVNQPIIGANVLVTWDGGASVVTDLGNGTYTVTMQLNLTVPRTYEVLVEMTKVNHMTASKVVNLVMARIPTTITGLKSIDVPVNESASVVFTVFNGLTGEPVVGITGYAVWETFGIVPLGTLANGSFVLDVSDNLPIGSYRIEISFDAAIYQVSSLSFELTVRPILTTYFVATQTIRTYPGATIEITIQYWDLDHNVGIDDVVPEVTVGGGNITYYPEYMRTEGNGTYVLTAYISDAGNFLMSVTFSKKNYATQQIQFLIQSSPSEAQVFAQNLITGGSISLIVLSALLFLYVKVFSVPKIIRWINALLLSLRKGKIPKAPPVKSRRDQILEIVNTTLEPLGIVKEPDDIEEYPIEAVIPEIDELLERLAEITGLGDEEIAAFKSDLARMKVSERPGFIREVIAQEEARRAESLAAKEGRVEETKPPAIGEVEADLTELRLKLEKKGISPDEIEIILEQARSLSKADLKALLDSLGIDL